MENSTLSHYLFQGFSVFLGVLAGTVVTVLTHLWFKRSDERQQLENLRFELALNTGKIKRWLEELSDWRNAVNGDCVDTYFGYFDFSRAISVTATAMFQSGRLYKHLGNGDIGALQEMFTDFSLFGEQYINNQVRQSRQVLEQSKAESGFDSWRSGGKAEAVMNIDFWAKKLKGYSATLEEIVSKLK